MKLLIVDDEKVIREGLLSLDWESVGIEEVVSAQNGLEAKEILAREKIDIVVSDIRMPGLDGLELSAYLRASGRDTIIILLTGFGEFEYAKEAIRHQVFEYLLKPVQPQALLSMTQRAVESIKNKVEKNKILIQYETKIAGYDTTDKILHSFYDVSPQMMDILTTIIKEYPNNITLNSLADKYHFSAIYMSRLIKKETGYSFMDILTGIRLMRAAKMLEDGKEKVQDICEKTGFSNQRYFSQAFKKIFDCTPSEYRKKDNVKRYDTITDMLEFITVKRHIKDEEEM